jgi:hypothetical protein
MTAIVARPETLTNEALTNGALDEFLEIVDRLSSEFPTVSIGELTAVVVDCRSALSGVPAPALPELLERLARVRLAASVGEEPATC